MSNKGLSRISKMLKVDYSDGSQIWLSEGLTLRRLIGILGMLLPVLLILFLFIATNHSSPLESISHYYFTRVNGIYIITISLLAIFLLIYKGKKDIDFYVSSLAGIFALSSILFPTDNLARECCDSDRNYAITFINGVGEKTRIAFHFITSGLFLLSLAYMSIFRFTQPDKPGVSQMKKTKRRNWIFKASGFVIIVAILVIFAGSKGWILKDVYYKYNLTFWLETLAVESFGISWMLKGDLFYKEPRAI
jgi:hypothetical protein